MLGLAPVPASAIKRRVRDGFAKRNASVSLPGKQILLHFAG